MNNTVSVQDPVATTLDSSELRVIHALAQMGSLTAAAQHLGLSQPAVSQRIKRVETRLNIPVIERSGSRNPTDPGGPDSRAARR